MEHYEHNDGEIWNMEDGELAHYAFKCADAWFQSENEAINRARDNIDFVYVDQWDPLTKSQRHGKGKPCYTNNLILPIQRKLVAEQRHAQPDIAVVPASIDTPKESSALYEGILNEISYSSSAEEVYSKCFSDQIDAGWGALLVDEEQESEESLYNVLRFPYIMDVLRCGWDPAAQKPNKTDGDFCFIYTVMAKKEFNRKWPDLRLSADAESVYSDAMTETIDKNSVMLLNFWCREYYNEEMVMLDNGAQLSTKIFNKLKAKAESINAENRLKFVDIHNVLRESGMSEEMLPDIEDAEYIPNVVERRKVTKTRILQFLVTKTHVLERRKFDAKIKRLPLVYVPGESKTIRGKSEPITLASVARTAQKGVNYCFSEIINSINKSFPPKFLATAANIANRPNMWNSPDIANTAIFEPDPNAPAFVPHIVAPPPFATSILTVMQQCQADVRSTLGRNDENMGDPTNTTSGKAVSYRQFAGDLSMGAFPDNLQKGIAELARCTIERIPFTYSGERSLMLRGKDGKITYKNINSPMYEMDDEGKMKLENDLSKGKFEIEVKGGASFISQKFAVIELLMQFVRMDPIQLGPLAYDLIAELYPIADAQTLVNRIKLMVTPPQVVEQENGEPAKPQPPTPQEQAMAMESKADMINAVARLLSAKAKIEEAEADSEGKKMEIKNDLEMAKMNYVETVMDMKTRNLESFAEMETAAINANDRQAERESHEAIKALEAENKIFTELLKT